MTLELELAIFLVGVGQLSVLVASALVPLQLKWHTALAELPPLLRQLFWVYGGYIVLSIVGLGTICLLNASELAAGSLLSRSVCCYGAMFWGVRLCLQPVFDVRPYLTSRWLHIGYHTLTVLFAGFTLVYLWGAAH